MTSTFEPELLLSFVAIAESGSFTEAARRVHRTQSAVSMQIKRLEAAVGRPVFAREGRGVALTRDGEILLGHARRILRAHQEAAAVFDAPELRGTVTLGTPDDYAATFLPAILRRFAEDQCHVHVEVVCDITPNLMQRLADDAIDLAIVTSDGSDSMETVLLREPVVWATSARHCAHEQAPLPLYHPGCTFRQWAVEALARQGRAYAIAYSSVSLAGIIAAVHAGLAVTPIGRSNVTEGLRILDTHDGFPDLPDYQVALRRSARAHEPIHDCLAQHIVDSFRVGDLRRDAL